MNPDYEVLKLINITKSFPGVKALDNVNFTLLKGEVHALVGENGAGKSTLIKIISGVYKKDSGQILLEGKPIEINNPRDAYSRGISTIHQEFNLIPNLNCAQNIYLGRERINKFGKVDDKGIYNSTKELFEKIGVNINPEVLIKKLGVAERQLVEICKALSLNAKILIMDEPTAVLSEKETDKLFYIINSLRNQGVSIIYISHRLDELFQIADRATVLRDGRLIRTVKMKDVNKELLTKMMIGRDLSEQYPKDNVKRNVEVFRIENLSIQGTSKKISFKLNKGEILGIYGLVGSGRTELARAIFGLDKIESGEMFLEGKAIKINSPRDSINKGIVLIPEDRKNQGLVLSLTIENNITLPHLKSFSKCGIINKKKIFSTTQKLIEKLNIRPSVPKKITKNLSGGNQQKVVIAKWMYQNCKVFIFDEPTRGVDVGAKVEIYKLINAVANQGAGVIMISSDLPEILGLSDRILVMKEGQIVGEILGKDATEEEVMKYAF
ncbi:MAG: ribose transport system ATP-binding protein [Thermoanaerobacteraceae bacterium]|jgi:ribose transport system ATP-binding protein|nr:ribose transport system ATP-binding protein [Thermoanaerobacteraceae bacterium]